MTDSMMGNKILSSKTDSNTWSSAATPSDYKKSIPKESNCVCLIGKLITFAINISNMVESGVGYYCCAHCLWLSLVCSFDSSKFTSTSSSSWSAWRIIVNVVLSTPKFSTSWISSISRASDSGISIWTIAWFNSLISLSKYRIGFPSHIVSLSKNTSLTETTFFFMDIYIW